MPKVYNSEIFISQWKWPLAISYPCDKDRSLHGIRCGFLFEYIIANENKLRISEKMDIV